MVTIRGEMRQNAQGDPEIWKHLGDIFDWLDSLPAETDNRIAAVVATEIREMLYSSIQNARIITLDQPQ